METTRKSFDVALIKGEIGEQIVKAWLEKKGLVVYRPETEGVHAFDMLAIKDKRCCVALDVKSKARRNKYPDTGIDLRHYETYTAFSEKHNMPFWIVFVDEMIGEIYGNTLAELDKPRTDSGKQYPLRWNGRDGKTTVYWPLSAMKHVHTLTEAERLKLSSFSQRNYEYAPENNATFTS